MRNTSRHHERRPLYLGIDTGTSACKAVLVMSNGQLVASASARYATRRTPAGEVSQDPADWLRAVASTARECLASAPTKNVAGICVTAPAHVGVLVGRDGNPLSRALLCFDARPAEVTEALRTSLGATFFEQTFAELTPAWTLPQLVWLRRELGTRVWSQAEFLLLQKDYVRYQLTGTVATDPSDAVGSALVDQRTQTWSQELCTEAGLVIDQLPPIRSIDEVAGGLTRTWARRLGLAAGIPVAVGGTDTVADLISVNALQPGDSIVKIASTGSVVTVSAEPHPHRQLLTYPLGLPGLWYSAAATSTAATAYNWLLAALGDGAQTGEKRYVKLDAAVKRLPPGSDGVMFLPFLEGERVPYWDRDLRGAFLGLSSAHTQAHLVRAAMEGVALSLRDCLELMKRVGLAIERPHFTGGGVASQVWRQILAAAIGSGGTLERPQGPAVGAALLAQAAASGSALRPRPRRTSVEPPPGWIEIYDRLYRIYSQAAIDVTNVSHQLARLAGERHT